MSPQPSITPLRDADLTEWIVLRQRLWPEETGVAAEAEEFLTSGRIAGIPHAVLVARSPHDTRLIGFAECSMPAVGPVHLEGWFISPEWRRQGIGRRLIEAVVSWTRQQGRCEVTSDTTAPYAALSVPAHLRCGFHLVRNAVEPIRFSLPLSKQPLDGPGPT